MAIKKKLAAALEYDPNKTGAPKVTAVGSGFLAEQIIALAKEANVPLHESPELAALLSQMEPGEEIPEQLYVAIAEILAFLFRLKEEKKSAVMKNRSTPKPNH
ncbi:EscU/YscU/HrcU family type III secretion system export apparatus switch protein [Pokkaliibacter sp. CJK22405]|uniref:EscU/YscU/HrcU family type III secretion system export apparatus switch protein n=1 Tax=Pokkaliibacter sp. CJK22405 TaxID=3384615 RepID=UPI0039853303